MREAQARDTAGSMAVTLREDLCLPDLECWFLRILIYDSFSRVRHSSACIGISAMSLVTVS